MIVSDYIAQYLESRGVTHVFELAGGMITLILDALYRRGRIKIISMHHEQAAGFAAEGYGRITGLPGIALATSGPGATNLLTAIGSCYFDSVPTVFITGQVNLHELKGSRKVRQLGFQETDIVSMARPITKSSILVTNADQVPRLLHEAFEIALSGRPGPVLVDIPMNIQKTSLKLEGLASSCQLDIESQNLNQESLTQNFLDQLKIALEKSHRPLILAGGGISSSLARHQFQKLAEKLGIPVVSSLMAVDLLPYSDPLRAGFIGSYGNRWANLTLSECDLLLVLGSRLDIRQTGSDTESFKVHKNIYHVDCESAEMNNRVKGCNTLVSDLRKFITSALSHLPDNLDFSQWLTRIQEFKLTWPDTDEQINLDGINPNFLMHRISFFSEKASTFVIDVGQHQMWAAQSLRLSSAQRFITSGGMGAMGFALPAGIGACLASKNQPIVVIAGDGGFQVNIQELQTIRRNSLPIKMIIINNNCHGMVRQFQSTYFDGRLQSTVWGYSSPSFQKLAKAYGIPSRILENEWEIDQALTDLWECAHEPFLLEVLVSLEANAYPKIAFGKPMSEMEPLAMPTEMEST